MIEWLIPSALVVGAAMVPKKKTSDKKKIEQVFKNRKVCLGEKYPKLLNSKAQESHTTYVYKLPVGLPSEVFGTLKTALDEALGKETETEFKNGVLRLGVFHNGLPDSWKYDDSLLRPGTWEVPIGCNHKGVLYHDFDKYAHFLIGGVPGFGKTILLKNMFQSLLLNNPEDVEFYILDLKGGLEFSKFAALPQVKTVASDIYEAAEVLNILVERMKKAEEHFRLKGYTNITETGIKKRTFVIVDEGAELSPDIVTADKKKYAQFCQASLSEITRIGRAVGYRCIYSTQYPSAKSVSMSVKMNIVSRISFIAASQISSKVILDEDGAQHLPSIPGRAIYKVEKSRVVQVPYLSDKTMFKMMEERLNESGKDRTVTNDHRQVGSGENQAPPKDS
jgi:DNA segregation ATPase FtsK/SpoIIIE, S-DNA-T family